MQRLILSLAAAVLMASAATAQTETPPVPSYDPAVTARIESVLGNPAPWQSAFTAIQAAVTERDEEALAPYFSYETPLRVNGEEVALDSEFDLYEIYDSLFTPEIVTRITEQKYEDLFVNQDGIMFGDGEVWLGGSCVDASCSTVDVKIIALQSTSQ
ncbi:hypothetical protein [Devosia sp.]|uniref:hypothetical protein n=1 Tax=Devosia sp. TaxID=1871048 RepID=UPI003A92AFDA